MSVKQGLLALLSRGEAHGYQLKTEFERRTAGVWPLNVGQIYTTLDRLERDGLVAPVGNGIGERNQRTYAITDRGLEELRAWLLSDSSDSAPPRDELLVKVLIAAADDPAGALEIIAAQRTALFSVLQARRKAQQSAAPVDLTGELIHDALAVRVEADLRWLDHCEARLREAG